MYQKKKIKLHIPFDVYSFSMKTKHKVYMQIFNQLISVSLHRRVIISAPTHKTTYFTSY